MASRKTKPASPRRRVSAAADNRPDTKRDEASHSSADPFAGLVEDPEYTSDGSIRPARVAKARRDSAAGRYRTDDVMATIVERLLDQWML